MRIACSFCFHSCSSGVSSKGSRESGMVIAPVTRFVPLRTGWTAQRMYVGPIESRRDVQFKLKVAAGLSRCPVLQALQDPVMVIAISEFNEGGPQFLDVVESAEPQDLFFEGTKEALDTSISFRLTYERRG